jgi:hypothetical protein
MNIRKLLPALAIAGAMGVVVVGAVRDAAASMDTAYLASALADDQMIRPIGIDIWPRNKSTEINLSQKNKAVEVSILAEPALNYSEIDFPTIEFAGALPASTSTTSYDANGDGRSDRVYKFTTRELKLTEADTIACLTAETTNRQKLRGCTAVKVIKGSF